MATINRTTSRPTPPPATPGFHQTGPGPRTLSGGKPGQTLVTEISDAEAIELLGDMVDAAVAGSPSPLAGRTLDFAGSLVIQFRRWGCYANQRASRDAGLSATQWFWVHKIVLDTQRQTARDEPPQPRGVPLGSFTAIAKMFEHAAQHLKWPVVRLQAGDLTLRLSVAGERAKHPGSITVTSDTERGDDGRRLWYGRILRDGVYQPARDVPDAITALLKRFAADPAAVASEYGRETGNCCFCGRELTDERSTSVGYGPICAEKFQLPWG